MDARAVPSQATRQVVQKHTLIQNEAEKPLWSVLEPTWLCIVDSVRVHWCGAQAGIIKRVSAKSCMPAAELVYLFIGEDEISLG